MVHDLKFGVRSLIESPTFTAVALVVLALGIGAGTAIFSVVDAIVLRGLPFDRHDRLAVVLEHDTTRAETFGSGLTTPQMYLDWRRLQESFEGLAAVGGWSFRLRSEQENRLTHAARSSPGSSFQHCALRRSSGDRSRRTTKCGAAIAWRS